MDTCIDKEIESLIRHTVVCPTSVTVQKRHAVFKRGCTPTLIRSRNPNSQEIRNPKNCNLYCTTSNYRLCLTAHTFFMINNRQLCMSPWIWQNYSLVSIKIWTEEFRGTFREKGWLFKKLNVIFFLAHDTIEILKCTLIQVPFTILALLTLNLRAHLLPAAHGGVRQDLATQKVLKRRSWYSIA